MGGRMHFSGNIGLRDLLARLIVFEQELIANLVPYAYCKTNVHVLNSIIRQRLPYEARSGDIDGNDVLSLINLEIEPLGPLEFEQYSGLWDLCQRCWSIKPSDRPKCQEMHEFLTNIRYVDLVLHGDSRYLMTSDDPVLRSQHLRLPRTPSLPLPTDFKNPSLRLHRRTLLIPSKQLRKSEARRRITIQTLKQTVHRQWIFLGLLSTSQAS